MKITLNLTNNNKEINEDYFNPYTMYSYPDVPDLTSGGTIYQPSDAFKILEEDRESVDQEMLDFLSKI